MQRLRLNAIPTPRGRQLLRALWAFGVLESATKSKSSADTTQVEVATSKHPLPPPHFALAGVRAAAISSIRKTVEAV